MRKKDALEWDNHRRTLKNDSVCKRKIDKLEQQYFYAGFTSATFF